MNVQRLNHYPHDMEPMDDGMYVDYDDYKRIVIELNKVKDLVDARNYALRKVIEQWFEEVV